jgi:hypothetical protein
MIADDTGPLTDFFRIDSSGRVLHSSNGDGSLGAITQATASTTNSPPVWLRLTRRGPVFQAAMCRAAKPDKDSDWTSVATVNFYQDAPQGGNYDYKSPATLDSRMYFGLFFEGNSPAAAAKVEGVRVTCPAPAPR